MDEIDLAHMRKSYERAELREETVLADPFEQAQRWLQDAKDADVAEPNAMCVATAVHGQPSARMVLLRGFDSRGLVFYTGYESRKGREIEANTAVAALFFWPQLERQLRVEGRAEPVAEDESDAYFASRPRGHQLGAWASEQSEPIDGRELLDQRMHDYEVRFEGEEIARPHSWGGFLIRPHRFEFWQGRPNRMHDRLEFNLEGARWTLRRLQP